MEILKNSNHDEIKDGFLGVISAIQAANSGSHNEYYIRNRLLSGLKKILMHDIPIEASYSRKSCSLLPCEIVAKINVALADEIQLNDYDKKCLSVDELYLDKDMLKTRNSIMLADETVACESYQLQMTIYSLVGDTLAFEARCEYPHFCFLPTKKMVESTERDYVILPINQYAHYQINRHTRIRNRASEYDNDTNGKFAPISKEAFFELLVWLTETQY